MKYEYGRGSSNKALHVLLIPENLNEVELLKISDYNLQPYLQEAITRKLGSNNVVLKADALQEPNQYLVYFSQVQGIGE